MKILFIAPRYTGGIGGHANRVAEKLRQVGFEVKLMHTPNIPIKNLKNPSFALFSSLKAIASREKYDVVHAFNIPSAYAMKYVNAKKKVLSVHGVYSEQVESIHSGITSSIVKKKEESILKLADILTTNSKDVQRIYKEKLGLDFELLIGPIDLSNFREIDKTDVKKKENQVIYIGRDSHEKGIDILKSIESKINGKVVYCTNIPWKKAMLELKASRVLVLPSRVESIPNVIKEAHYLKIPVVASNVGGIPEIVINEKTGLLVPPENPVELTKSINLLLKDKELASKLSDEGYQFLMKNFTWEVLLPKYKKFYEDLLKD